MPKKIKRKILSKRATPVSQIKMSEVIMDFAEPLLDFAEDDESKEKAISLALVCWNLALLPQDDQQEELKYMLHTFPGGNTGEIEQVVITMVKRKSACFPDIKKCVVDYKITRRGDDIHLTVTSTDI